MACDFFFVFFLFDDPCQKFTVPEANTSPLTWKASTHIAVWDVLKVHCQRPLWTVVCLLESRSTSRPLNVGKCMCVTMTQMIACGVACSQSTLILNEKKKVCLCERFRVVVCFLWNILTWSKGRELTFFLGYLLFWNPHVVKPHWQNKNPFCCYCCLGLHFRIIYHFLVVTSIEKDVFFCLFFMMISFSVMKF